MKKAPDSPSMKKTGSSAPPGPYTLEQLADDAKALFDALGFKWRELRLKKNDECPACGTNPTVTALIAPIINAAPTNKPPSASTRDSCACESVASETSSSIREGRSS